jgi:DNA repair protein RecN (Recombination protein N)
MRKKGAAELSAAVTEGMQQLAMVGGHFEIALSELPEGAAHGLEDIAFLVAANPGQSPRPLAKVASGGELSRIGLAIQVSPAPQRGADTDSTSRCRHRRRVGKSSARCWPGSHAAPGALRHHLPQVAAQADWQWSIAKETSAGATFSRVCVLDEAGRVEEVARMLGGVKITDTTRQHAREMLGV